MKLSVIILTYNADWNKLRATLQSILDQDYTDYEIVFADDGSKVKWNNRIIEIMQKHPGISYLFADSFENGGTVRNSHHALTAAHGEYVKLISPGDCLFDRAVLSEWVSFMDQNDADMTFGDTVYYYADSGNICLCDVRRLPSNTDVFEPGCKREHLIISLFFLGDTIVGAGMMVKRRAMLECIELMEGRIRFGEDRFQSIMVLANKHIERFKRYVLWYEYGTGISTQTRTGQEFDKWKRISGQESRESYAICRENHLAADYPARKFLWYTNFFPDQEKPVAKIIKRLLFPSYGCLKKRKEQFPKNPTDVNTDYIEGLLKIT